MKLAVLGFILYSISVYTYAEIIAFHHCEAAARPGTLSVFAPENEGYFDDVEGEFIVERQNGQIRVTANLREIQQGERPFFSLKPKKSTMGPSRWFKSQFIERSRGSVRGSHRIVQSFLGLETGSVIERFEITPSEIYYRQDVSERYRWIRCERK